MTMFPLTINMLTTMWFEDETPVEAASDAEVQAPVDSEVEAPAEAADEAASSEEAAE